MKKNEKPSWAQLKPLIKSLDQAHLLSLIKDLYGLNQGNRDFLHARFINDKSAIETYKEIIEHSLNPDYFSKAPISLSKAKKAISEYSKASKDTLGMIDLMVFYVEVGHQEILEYGDMYEEFYDSLLSMYRRVSEKVNKLPQRSQPLFRERLKRIMDTSEGTGWGYHEELGEIYYDFFSSNEDGEDED